MASSPEQHYQPPLARIGYALAAKKQARFIQPSLVSLALSRGIDLVPIDPSFPLAPQGPFAAVLHKLSGDPWDSNLRSFSASHPAVPVLDPPGAIARLHNRASMLDAVLSLPPLRDSHLTIGVPRQSLLLHPSALPSAISSLRFPLVAKPLVADGSPDSHRMSLIFHPDALAALSPPLVLQEFVNHGGVIFKVYVVGDFVRCMKRKSLPDISDSPPEGSAAAVPFAQVSNMTEATGRSEKGYYEAMHLEDAEMPPLPFLTEIAQGLRRAMELRLFNFDVIRDVKTGGNHYLVIDINYFPGYAKMPAYEVTFVDFFYDLIHQKQQQHHLLDGLEEQGECSLSGDNAPDKEEQGACSLSRDSAADKEEQGACLLSRDNAADKEEQGLSSKHQDDGEDKAMENVG